MQEKEAVNDPICPTFLQLKRNSKSASRRLHRRGLEEGGSVNVWEAAISEIGSTSYKSKTVPTTDILTDILGTTLNMSPYLFVLPSLFISLIHCLILCLSFLISLSLDCLTDWEQKSCRLNLSQSTLCTNLSLEIPSFTEITQHGLGTACCTEST